MKKGGGSRFFTQVGSKGEEKVWHICARKMDGGKGFCFRTRRTGALVGAARKNLGSTAD